VPARRRLDGNIFKFGARFGRKSEMGLNCILLPILGKLLVDRQSALDHRLLPRTRRCRRECARWSAATLARVRPAWIVVTPSGTIGAMGWTLGGQAVRYAAIVGGQTRWHDAGWLGGAGWTVGDRHPRLWCAWDTSAFCSFCPIVRAE